jgi:hypothetical protein
MYKRRSGILFSKEGDFDRTLVELSPYRGTSSISSCMDLLQRTALERPFCYNLSVYFGIGLITSLAHRYKVGNSFFYEKTTLILVF